MCEASTDTPKKHDPRMPPMIAMVTAAFFDSGLRNAGTPFDTASTPESATAPDENARSRSMRPRLLVPFDRSSASSDKSPLATSASTSMGPMSCTKIR
jgi:hypothetical protein